MMIGALNPYERSLEDAVGLSLVVSDGRSVSLDIERYLAACDRADETVLARCEGPVLDIGCGPGRMLHALRDRGIAALGIDIAATAVQLSRSGGAVAVERDVYAPLPGEGEWATALILDGNIGIGGDVNRLLARARQLVDFDGRVIVETASDARVDEHLSVRFARNGLALGPSFGWAVVGAEALDARSGAAGLYVSDSWSSAGRAFAELECVASPFRAADPVFGARLMRIA